MKPPTKLSALPGCHNHEHKDWVIGPVGVHRDSEPIDRCNWEVVTELFAKLDPEYLDHEIHHFGHWAVGWVDEIAYRPGSAIATEASKIRAGLEDYAILDEDRLGMMELEESDDA